MSNFLSAAILFGLATQASATCYWPTGNETYERDAVEHMPCSNETTSPLSTICCALNRTNPSGGDKVYGRTNDECLPNGLCRNRVLDHGTMQVSYWRETCTSMDWKTGLCLDICSDDWTSGNGTTGAVMTPCDGTETSLKWCCGVDTECCNDASKVKTLAFEFRGAIPNTKVASTAPWPTVTSTGEPQNGGQNNGQGGGQDGGLSTGAKAGIGVGAAVGGLLLIGLGFFLALRLVKKRSGGATGAPTNGEAPGGAPGGAYAAPGGAYGAPVHDPHVQEKAQYRYELEPRSRSELGYSPSPSAAPRKPDVSHEMP